MITSVLSFFSITLSLRRSELSTLEVVGATRGQVLAILICEAGTIGAFGGALGLAAGFYLARRIVESTMKIGGGMTLDFTLPGSTIWIALLGAIGTSVLAAVVPAVRATRRARSTSLDSVDV
jgi:putative ABC transport system permease protein